jgi:leucyl aminopeptidase (aminopeptidase T)
MKKEDLRHGVRIMLRECLGLIPGEDVVVLTDVPSYEHFSSKGGRELKLLQLTNLLAVTVKELAEEEFPRCSFSVFPFPYEAGEDFWQGEALTQVQHANVVLALTNRSISHMPVCREMLKLGARIASMPGFLPDMLLENGPVMVDYATMETAGRKIEKALKQGSSARLTSPDGTDLLMDISSRQVINGAERISGKGAFGNIPIGEVFTSPKEGSAVGRLVVKARWYPGLDEDMIITFRDGAVSGLSGGGSVGRRFKRLFELTGDKPDAVAIARRNCAELGVGLNPGADSVESVLEAEKIWGTVHVAVGDNSGFGGVVSADIHQDLVIPWPTLTLDGIPLIISGEIVGVPKPIERKMT